MYIKKKIQRYLIILTFIFSFMPANGENSSYVVLKINNEIITNIDIQNEKKYLIAINQKLEELDEVKIFDVAKKSLIREVIKKNELKRFFDIDIHTKYIDELLKDFSTKLDFPNVESLESYLLSKNLKIETVKNKLNIEALWNELIFLRYKDKVEIDENILKEKIKNQRSNKDIELLLISEIVFTANSKSEIEIKYKEIQKSIEEIGFDNTANIFSISETAKFGGKIGWVNKDRISKNIAKQIKNVRVGEYSNLINVPGGFLIVKIIDKKTEEIKRDEENELKQLITFERDRLLNEFSSIYFQKIKKNSLINEK
jgi:peptidyl-prolyl cis-trans isomerase SurA